MSDIKYGMAWKKESGPRNHDLNNKQYIKVRDEWYFIQFMIGDKEQALNYGIKPDIIAEVELIQTENRYEVLKIFTQEKQSWETM